MASGVTRKWPIQLFVSNVLLAFPFYPAIKITIVRFAKPFEDSTQSVSGHSLLALQDFLSPTFFLKIESRFSTGILIVVTCIQA
jgi:hypothetical protein